MSYLHPLRLHFSGQFQASISTVNNVSGNFNNSTFTPDRTEMDSKFGGFNPPGDAAWRLIGCKVTSATMPGGLAAHDPVSTFLVADSDSRVCGKLVDLDSEQQLVSTIWGLQVRITDPLGQTLLRGDFDPAAFMDIWSRSQGGTSDMAAGAMYQSVITGIEWGDVSGSAFLTALQAAALDGLLSIKFNVDAINLDFKSPDFMRGRIVGTIGPSAINEPKHFVRGRQLEILSATPALNWCVARVDESARKVYLDLGNALPTKGAKAALVDVGNITLQTTSASVIIGTLASSTYAVDAGWYTRTAGVVELPSDRLLSDTELQTLRTSPLSLTATKLSGAGMGLAEDTTGAFVRADQFVFRLNPTPGEPDNRVDVNVFATLFGAPLPNTKVTVSPYLDGLQPQGEIYYNNGSVINVGTPPGAISFPSVTTATDGNGVTSLPISASNPGNPRGFIDGQIYGLVLSFPGRPANANNQLFISLLVWDVFTPDSPITWYGSIEPIFRQYANLYPVMKRFMDLGAYPQVVENADLLAMAFGLDVANPNYMPVTRDLSWAKRQAILAWLKGSPTQPGLALGTAPSPHPAAAVLESGKEAAPAATPPVGKGGKMLALSRRLSVVRQMSEK